MASSLSGEPLTVVLACVEVCSQVLLCTCEGVDKCTVRERRLISVLYV